MINGLFYTHYYALPEFSMYKSWLSTISLSGELHIISKLVGQIVISQIANIIIDPMKAEIPVYPIILRILIL